MTGAIVIVIIGLVSGITLTHAVKWITGKAVTFEQISICILIAAIAWVIVLSI